MGYGLCYGVRLGLGLGLVDLGQRRSPRLGSSCIMVEELEIEDLRDNLRDHIRFNI
jgi:hypothetical protein